MYKQLGLGHCVSKEMLSRLRAVESSGSSEMTPTETSESEEEVEVIEKKSKELKVEDSQ